MSPSRITWPKTFPFSAYRKIYEVFVARKTNLITARARKNKRTARMLANARKDPSIPLKVCEALLMLFLVAEKIYFGLGESDLPIVITREGLRGKVIIIN